VNGGQNVREPKPVDRMTNDAQRTTIVPALFSTRQGMTVATKITIGRILLIPLLVSCLLYYHPVTRELLRWWALGVFVLGAISDGVDGYLARMHGQRSALGTLLDPLADKLLLSSTFLTLGLTSSWPVELRMPAWIIVTIVSRDVLLILGSAIAFLMTNRLTIEPSWLGKITTVVQMATVIAVLLQWPRTILQGFWTAAGVVTIASAIEYLRTGTQWLQPSQPRGDA